MPPKRKTTTMPKRTLRLKATTTISTTIGGKRKLEDDSDDGGRTAKAMIVQDGDEDILVVPKRVKKAPAKKKTALETPAKETDTPVKKVETAATKAETPAKEKAMATLDAFVIRTPSKASVPPPTTLPTKRGTLDAFLAAVLVPTTSLTQRSGNTSSPLASDAGLPPSLTALIPLHSALLTALLLHRAQHPAGTHPSFAHLKPHLERLTSHTTTLPTLRRLIFLTSYSTTTHPTLHLYDHGAGKVTIHLTAPLSTTESLKRLFRCQVTDYWTHTRDADATNIPLAPITPHQHAATIASVLHGRSKRLITELKSKKPTATPLFKVSKGASVASRSGGLLERIRAKAAAAEAVPTGEELVRRAAEGRVAEVMEILRGCRGRGGSLGMREVVERVRGSVKNPIGMVEAEMAVRIVGRREEWCEVKDVGGVGAVVFGGFEGEGRFV